MIRTPKISKAGIVDVKFGHDVKVVEPCNLYGCQIGDGSFIGPFVEIQSKAIIGKNCRIQSHSFICSLVEIGDSCFIGHGVTFTNDVFKSGTPSSDPNDWLPTTIGQNVSIGSGSANVLIAQDKSCVNFPSLKVLSIVMIL